MVEFCKTFVRSTRKAGSVDRFLGVRLTAEELERLDQFGLSQGSTNRSALVRALVQKAGEPAADRSELPVGLRDQIETLVEDGWAPDRDAAVTLVLTLGLQELARIHGERLPNLRQHARGAAERRRVRRSAEREGGGLLGR